jgi:hypothetical protein
MTHKPTPRQLLPIAFDIVLLCFVARKAFYRGQKLRAKLKAL